MFLKQKRIVAIMIAVMLVAVMVAVSGCGSKTADVVAEVNGEKITRAQLDAFIEIYGLLMPDLEQMLANEALRPMIEGQLLDAIIQDVVLAQATKELGITITDEERRGAYEETKNDMIATMFGSVEAFDQKVQEKNISESDLIAFLSGYIYFDKLEAHFAAQVSEDDITRFIDENPEFLVTPALLELSHILFETEEEALAARERITAGEDFGDVAVELSIDQTAQDEDHSAYRGYLGEEIPENTTGYDADFMAGANALEEDGQISEPVETQFGWHLIKLHGRVPAGELSGEEARAAASDMLVSEKVNTFLNNFYAEAKVDYLST